MSEHDWTRLVPTHGQNTSILIVTMIRNQESRVWRAEEDLKAALTILKNAADSQYNSVNNYLQVTGTFARYGITADLAAQQLYNERRLLDRLQKLLRCMESHADSVRASSD